MCGHGTDGILVSNVQTLTFCYICMAGDKACIYTSNMEVTYKDKFNFTSSVLKVLNSRV